MKGRIIALIAACAFMLTACGTSENNNSTSDAHDTPVIDEEQDEPEETEQPTMAPDFVPDTAFPEAPAVPAEDGIELTREIAQLREEQEAAYVRKTFTYGEDGWDQWIVFDVYDSHDELVCEIEYDSEAGEWGEPHTWFTEYDGDRLIRKTECTGGENSVVTFTYDDSGFLIKEEFRAGEYVTYTEYENNGNGDPVSITKYTEGGKFRLTSLFYDENGHCFNEVYAVEGADSASDKKYYYDDDGRLIREEYFSGNYDGIFFTGYTYDENGNMAVREYWEQNGEERSARTLTYYEYDPQGCVIRELTTTTGLYEDGCLYNYYVYSELK